LNGRDFAPFEVLKELPMAMTAHVVYAALDDRPATLSARMIDVIRQDIGYDGLLMTDDISMKALKGPADQNARAALDAGCDVVLHCNGSLAERIAVAKASGRMTDAAQRRAEAALSQRVRPADVDIPGLEAELETLF
ncbi:MAG: glycoside hydrolase family 3 N-terminal domain-containing protein, partial [Pseudomonadota bacterium]